jgi:hypothetical protein
MSTYAAPDAVGMGPPPGGPPPGPGDPGSMAALAAALGAGPGGPADGAGLPPGLSEPGAGAGGPPPDIGALLGGAGGPEGGPTPGGPPGSGDANTDLLTGKTSTDHIRAAIKHLMMAMTESTDDEESHGITKGMAALHGLLAGKQKNQKAITAAGG